MYENQIKYEWISIETTVIPSDYKGLYSFFVDYLYQIQQT